MRLALRGEGEVSAFRVQPLLDKFSKAKRLCIDFQDDANSIAMQMPRWAR